MYSPKSIQEYVTNKVIEYTKQQQRWVIVKVEHGIVDNVHIEILDGDRNDMLVRTADLIFMTKEDEVPSEESSQTLEPDDDPYETWWWYAMFDFGLVSIDVKLIDTL